MCAHISDDNNDKNRYKFLHDTHIYPSYLVNCLLFCEDNGNEPFCESEWDLPLTRCYLNLIFAFCCDNML